MSAREVVIVSAARTPMGKFGGSLSGIPAVDLGAVAVRAATKRSGVDPALIEEVIMGNVVPAGLGQAPARQAAIKGGLPDRVNAFSLNKVCGSGLKAVMLAAQAVKAGDADCVLAGGFESMSRTPYALKKARTGLKMGHAEITDLMILDGLWCAFEDHHMGLAGELVAAEYGIDRGEQDAFAVESHLKAIRAQNEGDFDEETAPVEVPQRKGEPLVIDKDESPRANTSLEKLSRLKPVFKKDGTVTAGNAPGVNDGAAAVLVTSAEFAEKHGLSPMARIAGYASAHREPRWVLLAPVDAVPRALNSCGLKLDDIDLIEANEAFAVQALAVGRQLEWDWDRVNVNGGAVALGHPIGASGARCLVTLLHAMKKRDARRGLVTLCLGGGGAVAMVVETV